ncbi:hypothetical protein [Streptomyces sp. NPDC048496]|uniref:hypothetical protein n=1 Tax=Streptomyces sp. NPDC048496 TaxID=3365558 RepID=UPI003711179B
MSCTCTTGWTVQLHDGGVRYPVAPAERHGELSYFFNARCSSCNAAHDAPFARVDGAGEVLADQTGDLPLADRMFLSSRCGPFTCGCNQEDLEPALS